jgi:hypothetical protein
MIKVGSGKESQEPCPGLALKKDKGKRIRGKPVVRGHVIVLVIRRTAVFVTRDRAQGQPAYFNCPTFLTDKG